MSKPTRSWRRCTRTIAARSARRRKSPPRSNPVELQIHPLSHTEVTAMNHALMKCLMAAVLVASVPLASAQPTYGNPSPTAGGETSQKANAAADQTIYQPVVYTNANKKGPAVVVIPGEIK